MVATVLYGTLSRATFASSIRFTRNMRQTLTHVDEEDLREASAYLLDTAETMEVAPYDSLPGSLKEVLERLISAIFKTYSAEIVPELERVHGTILSGLRRRQPRPIRGSITVSSERPDWKIAIAIGTKHPLPKITPPAPDDVWRNLNQNIWESLLRRRENILEPSRSYILRQVYGEVARSCFQEVPGQVKYLPAARSGLLQSHKVLSSSAIRSASLAGLEDAQAPAFNGVVADFLSELLEVSPNIHGDFEAEAAELEREVLHGTVKLVEGPAGYSEVLYTQEDQGYPLLRTSSMISEVAPVVLYLRHVLRKDDFLLIEEPEAHLHPKSQVAFARIVVKLVNRGLRILVTTHSEFFLQQINNAMVAGEISPGEARDAGFHEDGRLSHAQVSAYLFEPTDDGTLVSTLPITATEGISEKTFGEAEEQLYNTHMLNHWGTR